jgi:hypothetical protein
MLSLGLDPIFIACLLGGLIGGGLRALSTWNQDSFSRRSAGDLVVGSAMGVFLPFTVAKLGLVPPEMLAQFTPSLWFMACLTYGYCASSLTTNWITNYVVERINNKKD